MFPSGGSRGQTEIWRLMPESNVALNNLACSAGKQALAKEYWPLRILYNLWACARRTSQSALWMYLWSRLAEATQAAAHCRDLACMYKVLLASSRKTNNNNISRARKKRLTRSQELTSRQKRAPVLVYLSPMPRPFLCSNFIFRQCTSSPSNAFYLVKRCGVSASAVAGVSCTCRIR